MKTFQLIRETPGKTRATKVTGIVAEASVFSDGQAVLHWLTEPGGTEVYPGPHGEDAMREIRESSGRSRFAETGRISRVRPAGQEEPGAGKAQG